MIKSKILSQPKFQILVIVILTFLAYSNIFQNQFVGDDELWITTGDSIRHIDKIPQLFLGNEFNGSHTRYRPIGSTFSTIYYQLFRDNPFGYHLTSLLAHLISASLVYLITLKILQKIKPRTESVRGKKIGPVPKYAALITGLIFGMHPVNVETVSIIFSSISLGFCFSLLSFFFYLRATQSNIYNCYKNYNYYISLILAVFAFLSYELTIVLPLLIVLCDFTLKSLRTLPWKQYLPYFILVGLILFIRTFVLGISSRAHYLDDNFYLTMLVGLKVFWIYITVLIFPLHLTINRTILPGVQVWIDPFTNMASLRSMSILNIEVLAGAIVLIALVTVAIKCYRRLSLITFSIGWFLIVFLPVSYIYPQDTIMQERYIYMGVFGYSLVVGYLLAKVLSLKKLRVIKFITIIIIIIFLLFYGVRTYFRNMDWKNPVTMWSKLSRELPNHVTTNFMLGAIYAKVNKDELAIRTFSHVLDLEPNAINVYHELGKIYMKQRKYRQAIAVYNQALSIVSNYEPAIKSLDAILKISFNKELNQYKLDNDWTGKEFEGFLLFYPKNLRPKNIFKGVEFIDSDKSSTDSVLDKLFHVKFTFIEKLETSPDEFLKTQTDSFGKLINQGLAKVPNARQAYIKVWEYNGQTRLQVFLFIGKKVIKILVYPTDSKLMPVFEEMLKLMVTLK